MRTTKTNKGSITIEYWIDKNDNMWDKTKFKEKIAYAQSRWLKNCTNCIDCCDCDNCNF